MFPSLDALTINSTTPQPLIDAELLHTVSSNANNYATASGWSLLLITDGELRLGGSDISATTSKFPVGQIPLDDLRDDEVPWALAVSGTVHVQRFAQGLKQAIVNPPNPGNDLPGFGAGGFGNGGFGS